MKKTLYAYYRPTNEEFDNLWENCIVVPDTNVLLNLYRYSKETSDDFLNIFNLLSEQLWIPHQIALEYQKNRLNVIYTQYKVYSNLAEILKKQENLIISELRQVGKHPYIDLTMYQEQITTFFSELEQQMEIGKENHPNLLENDPIRDSLTSLFDGKVGSPYSSDELSAIIKEAKRRFESQIPPGYEDLKTKDGTNAYSDLIIWYQIIEKAKNDNQSIIFVTDEMKKDWWSKFNGKIVGPRPELVEEIVTKANVWFYMYRPDQFLTYSKIYLNQQVNQKSLQEIRDIQKQDNENSQYSHILLKKIKETELRIKEIKKSESSIIEDLEFMKQNLIESESTAETYQILNNDDAYEMTMLDIDEFQNQCYELENTLSSLNNQKDLLESELSYQKKLLNTLENDETRIKYRSIVSSSLSKNKK
nr:PIN domain-containing protein [uncultured Methanoregula sp.]